MLMAEPAQSMSSQAATRQKLFGTASKTTTRNPTDESAKNAASDSQISNASEQSLNEEKESVRSIWEKRWDGSPVEWREFVINNPKVLGFTEKQEENIARRNRTYVATPPLSDNFTIGTTMIAATAGIFGKILLTTLNRLHTYQLDILYDAIENRDSSTGLLTVSNHKSVIDDPFLLGAILPRRILLNPELVRWGFCSLDICFQGALLGRTLRLGKALPIQRRGGIGQHFLRVAGGKLSNGDWVHVFPEGRIRQSGMGYWKRGVGKLLAMYYEAHQGLPLIIPLCHEGIEKIMPECPQTRALISSIPQTGKDMFAIAGEPIDLTHIFHRLMPQCKEAGGTAKDPPACLRLYEEVADFMAVTMRLLRAELRQKVRADGKADLGDPFEMS